MFAVQDFNNVIILTHVERSKINVLKINVENVQVESILYYVLSRRSLDFERKARVYSISSLPRSPITAGMRRGQTVHAFQANSAALTTEITTTQFDLSQEPAGPS